MAAASPKTQLSKASYTAELIPLLACSPMNQPDPRHGHEDEPGHRQGDGSQSILPHLNRQQQTQVQMPQKPLDPPPGETEES